MAVYANATTVIGVGALKCHVKVPQLADQLGIGAMDLVRMCDLAVNTAYKATKSDTADDVSLDSCWKIFKGLRENDITITEEGVEREIRFVGDIVEFSE